MALSIPRALATKAPCGLSATQRGQRLSIVTHAQINPSIKKDIEKVVDMLKVEDLPKKVSCSPLNMDHITLPNVNRSSMHQAALVRL
jgi:hypothetical protein